MDKKFLSALLLIVALSAVLLYVLVISPTIQGYIVNKEDQARESTVQAILGIVDQQGYVAIGDGESSVVLVKYQPQGTQEQLQEDNNAEQIQLSADE